ncbi:glycoside hydrolase family 3 protein [Paramyrothecium foliicola]|nr:glycoside hydrolase family 3 protein [Paramyrothecium foliicola]
MDHDLRWSSEVPDKWIAWMRRRQLDCIWNQMQYMYAHGRHKSPFFTVQTLGSPISYFFTSLIPSSSLVYTVIMQISSVLAMALVAVGVIAQNGQRLCVLGAISCQYDKGRCAKICNGSHEKGTGTPAFIDPDCSCPNIRNKRYTGAACINVFTALGRHGCEEEDVI